MNTGVHALDKHPYPVSAVYPANEPGNTPLDAFMNVDTTGWVPSYSAYFIEYYGAGIQTETLIRDSTPLANSIYGNKHGSNVGYGNFFY
jgi:hypothetical protein